MTNAELAKLFNQGRDGRNRLRAELVELLKQGGDGWNRWRREYPEIFLSLSHTDLSHADLSHTDLSRIDLSSANLSHADLSKAQLWHAKLIRTNLSSADLTGATLSAADLRGANLRGANLSSAQLFDAQVSFADLGGANLSHAHLSGANFSRTQMYYTIITHVDLREAKGLAEITHRFSSSIDLHSVQLPQNSSALHFLRGVGVPNEWIDLYCTLLMHPTQYYSVFISYSSKDEILAKRLHADLQDQGVRCWFALEDMKIGDKFRQRIDEAIHLRDKLLLLLSEASIASTWVENEVEAALEKEDRQQREVLFPVRLDDAVMQTSQAWAATLRRTRHIGNFTNWTDLQAYQSAFDRLLRDLKKAIEQESTDGGS